MHLLELKQIHAGIGTVFIELMILTNQEKVTMYICLCFDVSKAELKKAIRAGHDSIEKLSEHLQVGNHCGGCIGRIEEILEKKPVS